MTYPQMTKPSQAVTTTSVYGALEMNRFICQTLRTQRVKR